MPSNRGVVYVGPGRVEIQTIDYPKFVNPAGIDLMIAVAQHA
jgi:glutathione-independent formaldehyde dehydrogenase